MTFYLGTHKPHWLARTDVPLFVSRRRLAEVKALPRARGLWCLDSGGFSELTLFGEWRTAAKDYAREAARYRDEVGGLVWAASQDWMCEPHMIARTGLDVATHQARSIDSYLELRDLDPSVPWVPVVQGWHPDDYLRHAEEYERRGVDLREATTVGVGSVCRRQGMAVAGEILRGLAPLGLRLHGFGLKLKFLESDFVAPLESFDSMAWSLWARKRPPQFPECTHKSCSNCLRLALAWRERVLARCCRANQATMF